MAHKKCCLQIAQHDYYIFIVMGRMLGSVAINQTAIIIHAKPQGSEKGDKKRKKKKRFQVKGAERDVCQIKR